MSLASIGAAFWPEVLYNTVPVSGSLTNDTAVLDSTTDKAAWVGRSPVTDTITKIYFRTAIVTVGTGMDVRIETVTNGRPSGTLWAANTNVVVTVADSDDNVWKTATLTAAASVNKGDEFAIVLNTSTGTPNMQLSGVNNNFRGGMAGLYPSLWIDQTGSYVSLFTTLGVAGYNWVVECGTAGVIYLPGLRPTNAGTIQAFVNTDSPDEYAMKFVAPMKMRVIGLRVLMFNIGSGGTMSFSLWPASSTTDGDALAQSSMDTDLAYTTTIDGYVDTMFSAAVELTAGTTYYAGVRADSAVSISVGYAATAGTGSAANAIRGFPIGSNTVHLSSRTWTAGNAGAWSDTTTTLPIYSLILDQLDTGAGGGGGIRIAGHGGLAA